MEKIINLTQHNSSAEQKEAGVFDLNTPVLNNLLTFNSIPTKGELEVRAVSIARMATESGAKKAMIGGAPFFMSFLEKELVKANIRPLYAFTKRVVTEVDGVKKSIFKHEGFVEVDNG